MPEGLPSQEYQNGMIEVLYQQLNAALVQSAKYAEQLQFARKELASLKSAQAKTSVPS